MFQAQAKFLILQPHLINDLRDKFEDEVLGKGSFKTPGTPRLKVCPMKILSCLMTTYRKGSDQVLECSSI
jgi:hypothetical protein